MNGKVMDGEKEEKLRKLYGDLPVPETVKAPGRNWTEVPELDSSVDSEPEIDVESSGGAQVYRDEEAVEKAGDLLFSLVCVSENRLNAFHALNLDNVIYIEAEGRATVKVDTGGENVSSALVINAKKGSEIEVKQVSGGYGGYMTGSVEIHASENSRVNFSTLETTGPEFYYVQRIADLEANANVEWFDASFAAEKDLIRTRTFLEGENSETDMKKVFFLEGRQHHDFSAEVHHIGKHTRCSMDTRGAVRDKSRSVYEGVQNVEEEAAHTSSFQDEKTLVLSEDAEADASPKLMIENDEVEATHAAAVSKPESGKIHYLKSRGLTDREAKEMLVKAFFKPLIREEDFRGKIMEKVEQKIRGAP